MCVPLAAGDIISFHNLLRDRSRTITIGTNSGHCNILVPGTSGVAECQFILTITPHGSLIIAGLQSNDPSIIDTLAITGGTGRYVTPCASPQHNNNRCTILTLELYHLITLSLL